MHPITFCFLALFAQPQQSVEDRLKELERKLETKPNQGNALNPAITVVGNMVWRMDKGRVHLEGDPLEPRVDDSFNVREMELDFRAPIDPHADGVAILAIHTEAAGMDAAIHIEELYATIKNLPFGFWENPPLATRLKLGRFRVDFGRINKLHLHDLPTTMYGLTINDFLGEEGYVANGLMTTSTLGSVGESGVLTLNLSLLEGGGSAMADDLDVPNFVGNLQYYADLSDSMSLDLGMYLHYGGVEGDPSLGENQLHSRTISLDALFKWKPKRQGEWNSFVVGFQILSGDRAFPVDTDFDTVLDTVAHATPMGFLVWMQYQLDRTWYVGVRFDQSDFIDDDGSKHSRTNPYVSCYLSEFFRIRASWETTTSDNPDEDGIETFLLEVNVVFGAHPPHPFWVNR